MTKTFCDGEDRPESHDRTRQSHQAKDCGCGGGMALPRRVLNHEQTYSDAGRREMTSSRVPGDETNLSS